MRVTAYTNIFFAVALNEPERETLIALTDGHELVAPEILPYEIGNGVAALLKRGRINLKEAVAVLKATGQVPVELRKVDIQHAIHIAGEYNIYAYDAYWLTCAEMLNSPILTLDKQMRMVARDMGLKVMEVER
jgi:predicted nucleic acid-binding protein